MSIMSDAQHSDSKGHQEWKAGWICPKCRERVPGWFETCWNCSETAPKLVASSSDRMVEIDGLLFRNLAEFSDHFAERTGLPPCCGNLDALNDILRVGAGFGAPPGGFIVRWKNHRESTERLGYAETVRFFEGKLGGTDVSAQGRLRRLLEAARRHEGSTVFDWIVEIIREHGPGGAEADDNIRLELA